MTSTSRSSEPLADTPEPRYLLLVLLTALAFSQPLLNLLGSQAEFLVAHQLAGAQLVVLALVLGILIPIVPALLVRLTSSISPAWGRGLYRALATVLSTLLCLTIINQTPLQGFSAIGAATLMLLSGFVLYGRFQPVRIFFSYLAPAVLAFPLVFLFASRASTLLGADAADAGTTGTLTQKPDIVFLVFDELPLVSLLQPDLSLNTRQFPNFARLAGQSNWYMAATTDAEVTVDAVPAALTGLQPLNDEQRLPVTANFPNNLFTLLQDDYELYVTETNTRLCPRRVCSGTHTKKTSAVGPQALAGDLRWIYLHLAIPGPWSDTLPSISNGWAGFGMEQAPAPDTNQALENAIAIADLANQVDWSSRGAQFERFVASIEAHAAPQLYFMHTLLPHRVWRYLADGRHYLVDEVTAPLQEPAGGLEPGATEVFGHVWADDPFAVNTARKRHLLQVQYVDTLLGQVMDRLEQAGMFEDTLIVVMGDHGAGFIAGQPRRSINAATLSDISAIPLLIKLPGQTEGEINTDPARLQDILPTIVGLLTSGNGWKMDGRSLLSSVQATDEIRIKKAGGSIFSYPREQHLRHLRERAMALNSTETSAGLISFQEFDDLQSLIGQDLNKLGVTDSVGMSFDLHNPQLYQNVNKQSGFVPLHLMGDLTGISNHSLPVTIGIAVNGVIAGLARTFDISDHSQEFEALIPEHTLQNGANSIDVLMITSGVGGYQLERLGRNNPDVHWTLGGDVNEALKDSNGRTYPIVVHPEAERVYAVSLEGGNLFDLTGNLKQNEHENSQIVVFRNGRQIAALTASANEFHIPVSLDSAISPDLAEIRVFLIIDNQAQEFRYPVPCSELWAFQPPPHWQGVRCDSSLDSPFSTVDQHWQADLDFSSNDISKYLSTGWVTEAGNGSWTVNQRASITLPVPEALGAVRFEARLRPYLHAPELTTQKLFVLVNGEPAGEWQLNERKTYTLEWEAGRAQVNNNAEAIEVTFLLPDARSPQSIGAGGDLRMLGALVLDLTATSEME